MAVEAQYLHLFSPQPQSQPQSQLHRDKDRVKNREAMDRSDNPISLYGIHQMAPICNTVDPQMKGGSFNVNNSSKISKKRSRDSLYFLGEDVSSQVYNHMVDVDRLILQHMANTRVHLSEKTRQFSNQIITAVDEIISKCMKSKDDEVDRLRRQNYALEERIKSLSNENNVWRYLAQAHEATAITLRANLEQVQAKAKEEQATDDAESCCCGDNYSTSVPMKTSSTTRVCKICGDGELSVLLLPCQHLCLCAGCGSGIETCPICRCEKTGSINVNLS